MRARLKIIIIIIVGFGNYPDVRKTKHKKNKLTTKNIMKHFSNIIFIFFHSFFQINKIAFYNFEKKSKQFVNFTSKYLFLLSIFVRHMGYIYVGN